jgi:hypothetical protein
MTPPVWLDECRRRVPTRSCWRCGRETPLYRYRGRDLRRHGWSPCQTFRVAGWCGCSQEYLPVPVGRGWWSPVPVWNPAEPTRNPLTRERAAALAARRAEIRRLLQAALRVLDHGGTP